MLSSSWQSFWGWVVFLCSVGAYIPLAIGGWTHPEEINVALFGLWLILSATFFYSMRTSGFAGWRMPLGWLVGNAGIILLAFGVGGYTFNLGECEGFVLFGIVTTLTVWATLGAATGKWNARVLYLGGILWRTHCRSTLS